MTDFLAELRDELLDGLERHERAQRWRRPWAARRPTRSAFRARRIAAVAIGAAAIIALVVQIADRAREERVTTPPVSRLEGFYASGAVVADGSLWVAQYDLPTLLRIDLGTGRVRARVDVGGSPGGLIAAAGALWIHDWERGRLVKVDANTNRVVKTLTTGPIDTDFAFAVGAVWTIDAGGAVWMIDAHGTLLRVDPDTVTVTKRVSLGAAALAPGSGVTLAGAGDVLWILAGNGRITEVDARTGNVLGRARGPAKSLASTRRADADTSGLWISSRRAVVHIDARTRRATRYPVAGDPGALAIVDGRVWVTTLHDTGTSVTVLDSDGRIVDTTPLPAESQAAQNVVPSPGGAWITFGKTDTVSPAALRIPNP